MKTKLVFDAHLDLGWNALDFNRDLRLTLERIRRRELTLTEKGSARNTVCFPEMRRGNVGLCVATQLARHLPYFARTPGVRACLVTRARNRRGRRRKVNSLGTAKWRAVVKWCKSAIAPSSTPTPALARGRTR